MEGARVRKMVFLGLFLGMFVLVARLFYPFLTIFVWSGILYALLSPLQRRILRRSGGEAASPAVRRIVSGLLAVGGMLLLVLPCVYLAASLMRQVFELTHEVRYAISTNPSLLDLSPASPIGGLIYRLTDGVIDLSKVDVRGEIAHILPGRTNSLLGLSGIFLRSVFSLVLGLVFLTITLYFLLMDGRKLMRLLVGVIPIERSFTLLFIQKLRDSARSLARGYVFVMIIIAAIMFGVYSIFEIKGALFFGVLTAFSTFVPVAGPALVLIPVAAIKGLGGNWGSALLLLGIGVTIVTLVDTIVRPHLLKDRLAMHPLLILFSILGGIEVFGFNGVVLGPLIFILFFAAAELYERIYEPRAGDEEDDVR